MSTTTHLAIQLAIQLAWQRAPRDDHHARDFEAGYWDHAQVLGKNPNKREREGYKLGWQASKQDTRTFQLLQGPQAGSH